MVSKRRSKETVAAAASPAKKTKQELAKEVEETVEEVEEETVEEEKIEENESEEEKLDDDDEEKEEMQVVDEANDDAEDEEKVDTEKTNEDAKEEKPKEKEYTMEMPEDISDLPEEAVEVTVKCLSRGKVAVVKYVEAIKRAYDIITVIYPDEDRVLQEASLKLLKDFNEEISTVPASKITLSDETKKAFAYHVEICKTGMPKVFQKEPSTTETKAEPDETHVQKLFKKAPKLSVDKVNDVINKGAKLMKEKQSLLDGLNDLNEKMQIVDNALCTLLVESNTEERQAWQFFQENSDKIIELFPLMSGPELVILETCKDIGNKVLEKMSICRKNWTSLGTQISEKSPSVSNLVNGPLVTADQLAEKKNLTTLAPETRSTLLNVITGIKKKIANNVTDYVKKHMTDEDLLSFNYIVNDLEVLIGKHQSKSLMKEEKMYIGYHLSKVRPYVSKITDLHNTKTILEGSYEFHERAPITERRPVERVERSYGSPRGGTSFRRGGSDYRKDYRSDSRNGGSRSTGYRGSSGGYRGSSGGGFQKSFNHYGAY